MLIPLSLTVFVVYMIWEFFYYSARFIRDLRRAVNEVMRIGDLRGFATYPNASFRRYHRLMIDFGLAEFRPNEYSFRLSLTPEGRKFVEDVNNELEDSMRFLDDMDENDV